MYEDILSTRWFTPAVLKGFDWGEEVFLYLIIGIPVLFILRWLLRYRVRQKLDVALPEGRLKADWSTFLRFIPPFILSISITLMLIALARPQKTNEQVEQWTEGIDIMLILDISHSMKIEDFVPNRMEAAKKVAARFIDGRIQDRIGLVIFSGEAISYAPLTTDYSLLKSLVKDIDFSMIEKPGTAIGSALGVAINRMTESDAKSKVAILLSDGENTAGNLAPKTAAELAYGYGVKVYTIGVGKEGRVPYGTDMFGRPKYMEQHLDETALRDIARIGQGKYFRATNNKALTAIFDTIDKYEKAEIKETRYKDTKDYYQIYLVWGMFFLLIWMLLKSTFLTNALED
ncbi:VWA domain-containing protein [Flammeovirga pectinis]|uniref:VWA domain-containing protein n=1 Tax=Flammeovirga pectinis TaxID=2494373 RepID=A0A3Q9FSH2_9BACT|nr:VWA domain-containing protein [Flammeovirga pectinis]AZQ63660.1 VWA domain-containing protein [Flammeovirga pectinis]